MAIDVYAEGVTGPTILTIGRSLDRHEPYLRSVLAAGGTCELRGPEDDVTLDGYAGLLLMGGTDVDAARYGQSAGPENDPPDVERDARESQLLEQAFKLDLPVLAICRGMQLMNVVCGGTLIQHLPGHRVRGVDYAHDVLVDGAALLAEALGQSDCVRTNSRHHQAVDDIGQGLQVSARASDGVIEGIERPRSSWVVGVQWHPEDLTVSQPEQLRLFQRFVRVCRSGRGG